ncbi:MAG TPA: GNAT family N-acetyltransferase [Gemmatimonadaceae bacterium]|nr:GNAT family N-acetyltransferase [Gemmatimonadaceae bacterium]
MPVSADTVAEGASFGIRVCRSADASVLAATGARLFVQAYGPTHPEPTLSRYLAEKFDAERLRAELEHPAVRFLLVEDAAGEPIGYAHLRETVGPPPAGVPGVKSAEIVRFYVDAAWHGRGIAQALMTACEAEARRRGADALWLQAWQQAGRALAFYHRAGFRVVGTATFHFGERRDDDFLLARPLAPPEPPAP